MIPQNVQDAFNAQIQMELASAYIYDQMEMYFAEKNLTGMANFMKAQAEEERVHARKFIDHIVQRGGQVRYQTIEAPRSEFSSCKEVFELALGHEKKVSASIRALMNLSIAENDYASKSMLTWFIDEQVEEESSFEDILALFSIGGDTGHALLMIDAKLGERTQDSLTQ